MDKSILNQISTVVNTLVSTGAKVAVKYLSDKQVIRASRRTYKYLKGKFDNKQIEIVLNICRPNYNEREFIKDCKKAGEPFPIKNIQIKMPVIKKK